MTPPAPPGQHHKGGKSLSAWIHAHQGEAAAIGIGGAIGLAFLIRRMASGGSSSTTATPDSTTGTTSGVAYGYGDTGSDSTDSQYEEQQQALDSFLNQYTQGTLGSALFPNGVPLPTASSTPPASTTKSTTTTSTKAPITKGSALIPAKSITVPNGASLLSLSKQYLDTTNRTLLAHANGLGTGAGLRAGQTLIIPAHQS